MKTLRTLTLALVAAGWLATAAAQGLRPEVGKPLQQAGEYLKAGKAKEATGRATDNERLEAEGRTDQSKSDLKQAGEKVKDAFKKD